MRPYLSQLDSLRAVAVFAVILGHFAPRATQRLPLGELGVRLFFVLSGFLITRILLDCRALIEDGARPAAVIGRFYARRLLRIAPAYYGLLAIMWLAAYPEVRDSLPWHLAYLSNIYFAILGTWRGATSHLWSLAVEEQFYLLWPMIVLFQPERRIKAILALVIVVGPLFRFVGAWNAWSPVTMLVLPFGAADSLALGALLASVSRTDVRARAALTTVGFWAGPAAFALTALSALSLVAAGGALRAALSVTLWSLWFVWVIDRVAVGVKGRPGMLLSLPALTYLGRISYGLYLFHALAPRLVNWVWTIAGFAGRFPPNALAGVGAPIVATILIASLSWKFYEHPLNQLKARIPYDARRQPSVLPRLGDAVLEQR